MGFSFSTQLTLAIQHILLGILDIWTVKSNLGFLQRNLLLAQLIRVFDNSFGCGHVAMMDKIR